MNDKPILLVLRGIVKNEQGKYLLMQRSCRSTGWPGYWEFPGGKADPGEGHKEAFIREMKEETGFSARPGKLFAEFEWEREFDTVLYRIFWAQDVSGDFQISPEHDSFGWFSVSDMKNLKISPPLLGLIQHL